MLTRNIRMTQWTYDMLESVVKASVLQDDITLDEVFEYALFSYAKDMARNLDLRRQATQDLRDHMEADI